MKKSTRYLGMAATAAVLLNSCVTNEYDLNNINTEMTIGGDVIEFPIGYLEKVTIDSLLKGVGEIDFVGTDENGDLRIAMDSSLSYTIDAIKIDPIKDIIPTIDPINVPLSGANNSFPEDGFQLPAKSFNYTVEIPTYTVGTTALPSQKVDIDLSQLDVVTTLSKYNGITLPSILAGQSLPLQYPADGSYGSAGLNMEFSCPEQIKNIGKVWFAGDGARVRVNFELGGLSAIASNNVLKTLEVNLPDNYLLVLENNLNGAAKVVDNHKLVVTNYNVGESGVISLVARLKSVDMSKYMPNAEGKIVCNDELTYKLDYGFTTKSGKVSISPAPKFEIEISDAAFGDAQVVSNEIIIPSIESATPLTYDLAGISPDLKSIRRVDFDENQSKIEIKMNDLGLPFKAWNECEIEIGLPECFRLDAERLVGATLDESGHTLTTTISALVDCVVLPVNSLEFGDTGAVVKVTGEEDKKTGTLEIRDNLSIKIAPKFPAGEVYLLSDITSAMGDKDFCVTLDESKLVIVPATSEIVINELGTTVGFSKEIQYTIKDIRSELRRIDHVSVTDSVGEAVTLDVAFTLSETPVDHLLLRDFKVELPQCLWVECEGLDENNVLTIDNREVNLATSDKISLAEIKILGIKDLDVVNGSIIIDDSVKISGQVAVKEGEILHGVTGDIVITPLIKVPDLYIGEFAGNVNIDISDYMEPVGIDLSEFTKQLTESDLDIEFGLVPPTICIDVTNPIGIAIDGELLLTTFYPDGTDLRVTVPLHLNGAGQTQLCITDNANNAPSADYTTVIPENYQTLFSKIPSKIEVKVNGGVDENTICTLALGQDYKFDLGFAFELPLAMNANVSFEGKIEDLADTFSDIPEMGVKIGEVGVVLETESTLPIELLVEVEAVDKEGKKVEDIGLNISGGIGGCLPNGQPKKSTLGISFGGNIDKLKFVDAIQYKLRGKVGADEAAQFNVNQYLQLTKSYVRIEKGITFDIAKLMDEQE